MQSLVAVKVLASLGALKGNLCVGRVANQRGTGGKERIRLCLFGRGQFFRPEPSGQEEERIAAVVVGVVRKLAGAGVGAGCVGDTRV